MEFSLYIISHVGTVISLVCLALAIATFLLCRAVQNQNTYMHLHLCVCLFLAKLLFLMGVDKTDNQVSDPWTVFQCSCTIFSCSSPHHYLVPSPGLLPVCWFSFCWRDKYHDQKQLEQDRVYSSLYFDVTVHCLGNPGEEAEAMEESCLLACFSWHTQSAFLYNLEPPSQR